MKFSFIVPLYNDEKNVRKCIEAIYSECNSDDEIIIIDNGSTDKSIEIVSDYNDLLFFSLPNKTIGELRNYGANQANGDIIAFIDSDCIICKGWRKIVQSILLNETIAATGSKYQTPTNPNWIEKIWFSQRNKTPKIVKYINSGNFAIKSNVFRKIGGFNSMLVTGEDAELGLRLSSNGLIILEHPDISCVHLGNPQNLYSFYKKQKWHATGMLGTFKYSFWDKPLILTLIFLANIFLCILLIPSYIMSENTTLILFTQIILALLVPIISSIYRLIQYNISVLYFPFLVILYLVYFTARASMLLIIILNWLKK